MTADDWFAEFIRRCQKPGPKRRRVLAEAHVGLPAAVQVRRSRVERFDLRTEQLRRWLRREVSRGRA